MKQLEEILRSEIPLSVHIDIKVEEYNTLSLSISAPLAPNINHKNTAFGGSLYCVSVLCGWGLIYMTLKANDLAGQIVIQDSNIKYLKPVKSDIVSHSSFESQDQCDQFLARYKRKGIARVKLKSTIRIQSETCVEFNGSYVVHK